MGQDREDNKKVNAGGYTSSSSANSDETVRLFCGSNQNDTDNKNENYTDNNDDSESVEQDRHSQNYSDKEYKTRRYIKQKDTIEEKPEVKSKKKYPFTYQLKKKFKEDSVQPPNLIGEIEHKNTIERAYKIRKISYIFSKENMLSRNKTGEFEINGSANQTIILYLLKLD